MSSDSAPAPFDGDAPSAPRKRSWLPYAGGALLLALIVAGLWPRPLPVETATAARGPLMVTVDEEGQTRVRHRYVVSSPVAGHLRRIDFKPGAIVEAGQTVLATLETGGADLLDARSLAQAEARVRGAESAREQAAARQAGAAATLALVRTELTRARRLADERVISRQDLDAATTRELTAVQEERAATFGLQVAEYELEQARAVLNRGQPGATGEISVNVTSPVGGRILRVMQESARNVPAGFPLLEVGDPADLEVRIEVLSRDGVGIAPGARVFLEQWGGEKPLEARVRLVEPAAFTKISALGVEEQRVYVIADFVDPFEARPTLGDGYRVEARIVQWSSENVLRVPAGALFQRDGAWQTFVVDGGRARLRTVKPGRSNGIETEIVEGLPEGTTVVVYPGDRVVDGSRVSAIVVAAGK
ncbi:MAG TPA: HlyD family efflux transporter periplasmic adaptor subunit [Opitutaceae bacterium]